MDTQIKKILRKKKLPKGIRKYVRRQKAMIRKSSLSENEKQQAIQKLYEKIISNP